MRMNRIAAEIKLDDIAPAASSSGMRRKHILRLLLLKVTILSHEWEHCGWRCDRHSVSDPAGSASSRPAPSQPAPRRVSAWERVKEERSPDKVGEDIESRPTHGIERERSVGRELVGFREGPTGSYPGPAPFYAGST